MKDQPIRYASYYWDTETSMYYLMARYYHPTHGVFLSIDPELDSDETVAMNNGYLYAANNPIKYIDSGGRKEEGPPMGGGGGAIGIGVIAKVLFPKVLKISKSRWAHVVKGHIRKANEGKKVKGKFSGGESKVKKLINKTFKNPTEKYKDRKDSNRRVYEKRFDSQIGVDKDGKAAYILRLIVDKNGNLITSFPVSSWY